MSIKYLNLSGLENLWINIKNYILSKIPTKTSELTNDSGYLTSHQSLDNYVTLNSGQTITAIKTITGGNQGKMLFKNPNYTKGDAVESGAIVSRLYFGNGTSYATANGVLTTDINSAGNTSMELCAINNTASSSYRASLIITYDKSAARPRLLKSWGDFIPNSNDGYSLGNASNIWKECYCNAYYLGTTAFGDIVTHNASEFLASNGKAVEANRVQATIDAGTTAALVQATVASNDCFRIAAGGAANAGWAEIATGDDANEPIYVRQYKGAFTTLQRTATLLDGSGNTSFPGTVTATTFSGALTGNVTGNCSGSSGSCTGNAATATQFSANTTVALTGDATGTSAGSKKGWSVPVTLANSGVTAGDYGPSADASPSHGGTFSVPYVTVDAKGRVTAASTKTITLPTDSNTDTKVTQTVTTGNSTYPVLLCATANATTTGTTTSRFSAGLTVNTRYSSIYITNKYDTANTKGVRNTSSYNNGILYFRSYDDTQMGLIRCDSHKSGYQHIYMQASNYIKDGAINPEGTATTCSIAVRVRDNGSKTIYTEGSWENSLTPYANETYDLGTSSLRWLGCYCKNFYGSYVDIAGRYIGNEYSTNARTCLYLKSNRDTDGKSGIYFSKFRQNRAQGALTGSDLVDLSLDVLENSVRTNSCISISFRYFENDVPTKIYVIPKKSATSYMGTSDNPWTNAYITNLNLNGNAFDPTSIDGVGTVKLLAYLPTSSQEYTMNAGTIKAGSNLGEVWAFDAKSDSVGYLSSNMSMTQSGTWKLLNFVSVGGNPVGCKVIGLWVKIA